MNGKLGHREFDTSKPDLSRQVRKRLAKNKMTALPNKALSHQPGELHVLERRIIRIYDAKLAGLRLSALQFLMLQVLRRRGPSAISSIAQVVNLRTSVASRNFNLMTRNGWVLKRPNSKRRRTKVSITGEGDAILRAAYPLWRQAQQEAVAALGGEGCLALDVLVKQLLISHR